jgi:hypothetical protein
MSPSVRLIAHHVVCVFRRAGTIKTLTSPVRYNQGKEL